MHKLYNLYTAKYKKEKLKKAGLNTNPYIQFG
jgi:ubiquitin